jgi:hypothetical protein
VKEPTITMFQSFVKIIHAVEEFNHAQLTKTVSKVQSVFINAILLAVYPSNVEKSHVTTIFQDKMSKANILVHHTANHQNHFLFGNEVSKDHS